MKKYKVGVLGATGMVGRRFVSLLENHPWFELKILAASSRSAGKTYKQALEDRLDLSCSAMEKFANFKVLDVTKNLDKIAAEVDFVFGAINMTSEEIRALEEAYAKRECPVISNNSAHRRTEDVPIIIPEINAAHARVIPSQKKRLGTKRGFIAVKPNCSLQCYVPAVHPLLDLGVNKILVCTYQAISGAGKTFKSWPDMIDNLIPYIPGEEEKSEWEPLKIWGKIENDKIVPINTISITSQCFRVPISDGHTAAVFLSFSQNKSPDEIIKRWEYYTGYAQKLNLPSAPKKLLHYFKDIDRPQIRSERELENGMAISIGRLREDSQYNIKFVCMSHNTVRGAAGGAILMAELLCSEGYL
ncbi:MAG: aspartate-semialdehyde dehydrogenase [Oscillospiraceae bacterium]|nr:aspartate-semialdehyde dehydrogenase [Oscillospiraceae bacterium]